MNMSNYSPVKNHPITERLGHLARFHSIEADALYGKHQLVDLLIGKNHHNYAVGYHCEVLLKEYLRSHLPENFSVDSGFICCDPFEAIQKKDGVDTRNISVSASPQIDILIHDTHLFPPIYKTGDYAIVRPLAVRAIIEVKKNLTINSLCKGLDNINDSLQVVNNDSVFSAVFAFDGVVSGKTKSFVKVLEERKKHSHLLPDAICVMSRFWETSQLSKNGKIDIHSCSVGLGQNNYAIEALILSLKIKCMKYSLDGFNEYTLPSSEIIHTIDL